MIIPKKPGTYWFNNAKSGWSLWGVSKEHVCRNGHYYAHHEFQENYDGTFGPIVPGPDELTAMENIVGIARAIYGAEVVGMLEYDELTEEFKKLDALRKDEK